MKNAGLIFLTAVVIVLSVLLIRNWGKERVVELPPEAREAVDANVKNIQNKVDDKGFHHAVINDKENVVRTITELDSSAINDLDSVSRLLQVARKQIVEWREYATTLEERKLPADRTPTGFKYKDEYASIELVKPKDSVDTGYFNFKYDAQINYTEYWRRDWILGKKKHYIDFWIADPRATINGGKRVKFEPSPQKVKVDVNAVSFYTDRLNLGVDGGVTVGRTRVGGGYYYDMMDKKWKPVVGVKYRLLEF